MRLLTGKGRASNSNVARVIEGVIIGLLVVVAIVRMAATYDVYCQTYDEPPKLARGMEWCLGDRYRYVDHPPLACVMFAILPVAMGTDFTATGNPIRDGNAVLYDSGRYELMLTVARLGNLVFFLAATLLVWIWSRQIAGPAAGALGVLFFTTLPTVLGHSAIVSTDMAVTATVGWAIFVYQRWLKRPSLERSIVLGAVVGLALLSKYSALVFLPVGILGVTLTWWAFRNERSQPLRSVKTCVSHLIICLLVAAWVVWAGYQFSVGRVADTSYIYAQRAIEQTLARSEAWQPLLESLLQIKLPAPEFVQGLLMIIQKEHAGHANYFLGQQRGGEGSWLFFPTMLAVKTPLSFTVLTLLGATALLGRSPRDNQWECAAVVVVPLLWLASVLASDINIGVRHILPVYVFGAMAAAWGSVWLWESPTSRNLLKAIIVALVVTHLIAGFFAHPDYLPYHNWLAGDEPEWIAVDSDLDWGQDLPRLAAECRRREISALHLAYFGTANVYEHSLPDLRPLQPGVRVDGWVAISLTTLKSQDGFAWLEDVEPAARVGHSILLYNIQ